MFSTGVCRRIRHVPKKRNGFLSQPSACIIIRSRCLKNNARTPLARLIDFNTKQTGEDPIDFVIREIIDPLYEILFYFMFKHGILIEPHGQNFYLEIDDTGKIRRIVLKDWKSTMVDLDLRLKAGLSHSRESIIKHLLGVEAARLTSLSIIVDHYWGNYLMRQLLKTLVDEYHGVLDKTTYEQLLLKKFKDVFERYYQKYPESQTEFTDISLRHGQKPPEDILTRSILPPAALRF